MIHTMIKLQDKIINSCKPQGTKQDGNIITDSYRNTTTGEDFEILYDDKDFPLAIKNLTTGKSMERS